MNVRHLNNQRLMSTLQQLVADDCAMEAELLATIGEVDRRGLYRQRAHPNMFRFCVDELHLSESVAAVRITVARGARRFPKILDKIRTGELHLTGARMLLPHLSDDTADDLIAAATHKSRTEIEKMLAVRYPKPDVRACVRKLPTRSTMSPALPGCAESISSSPQEPPSSTTPGSLSPQARCVGEPANAPAARAVSDPRAMLAPLSAERYKVQFTADAELHAKVLEAQELLGHSVRKGDLASLFSRSLDLLIADVKKKKHGVRAKRPATKPSAPPSEKRKQSEPSEKRKQSGPSEKGKQSERAAPKQSAPARRQTTAPGDAARAASRSTKKRSRYIPRVVRRAVFERDEGQCSYVDSRGKRCCERAGLQYHHRDPFGRGGESTATNLELRCLGHNALAAEEEYGTALIEERRARSGSQKRPDNADRKGADADTGAGVVDNG